METGNIISSLIHRHNAVHGRKLEGREGEVQRRLAEKEREKEKQASTKPSISTTDGGADDIFATFG